MNPSAIANAITAGKTALGVEFGSTRIKAVLVGEDNAPHRLRQPRMGKPLRKRRLDLPSRRRVDGPAGRLPRPLRRGARPLRRAAAHDRRHRLQRHDARLPALRQGRQAARPLPHLAQHHDRRRRPRSSPGCSGFNIPQRWSIAHLDQAILNKEAARQGHRLSDHAGRLRALAADGREGDGRRRGLGHVPHRQQHQRLRRAHARPGGRALCRGGDAVAAGRHPAQGARGGRSGRRAHRRRRQADRPQRAAAGGHPALPARGRCRHRHGGHQQRGGAHRQRLRRHLRLCHDRPGEAPVAGLPRDRHGHHALRQAGGDGAQQQLHHRPQRLGRPLRRICRAPGGRGQPVQALRAAYTGRGWGATPRGAACWPTTTTAASTSRT